MARCSQCGSNGVCRCGRSGKPGTQLSKIIPDYFKGEGCGCEQMAAWMDIVGPRVCEQNLNLIVRQLVERSEKFKILRPVPVRIRQYKARRWVERAIRQSKLNP